MTTLSKLSTSLTKHGAHKIAYLLEKYDKDEVLKHLSGTDAGINIDSVQAHKNLSATSDGVPEVWNLARAKGKESINSLVLIAIIFSHYKLITAMKVSAGPLPLQGTIKKGIQLDKKEFSNFKHTVEELGFGTDLAPDHITYDLTNIFEIEGMSQLALEIFSLKLTEAGWDKKNSLLEEVLKCQFHKVFSVSIERFSEWLSTGVLPTEKLLEDASFFLSPDSAGGTTPFKFVPGHNKKKTGKISVSAPSSDAMANLLHNQMQNELFDLLESKFGKGNVSTENDTGQGTSIDIVVKTGKSYSFYEIKTAFSAKACIRQAVPQLLEYAYWDCDFNRADRLIIVGPVPVTPEAENYLEFLRKTFNIPIFYECHAVSGT